MRKTFQTFSFVAVTALMISTGSVQAATVFTTYGPGNTYFPSNGRSVTGNSVGFPGYEAVAIAFTPTQSSSLSQIDIALTFNGIAGVFGTDNAVVSLENNNSGMPSGTNIESWSVTGLPPSSSATGSETLTANAGIILDAGTTYWVVATPTNSNTVDIWNTNSNPMGVFGNEEIYNGTTWSSLAPYDLGAFDVQGSAVPEPASVGFLAGGLALLAGLSRRRRKA